MIEEKVLYGSDIVYLTLITKEKILELNATASSVHSFPIKENKILATFNQRGFDIIGGHVEVSETAEDALIRECYEEGYIIPLKYELIGAIRVDNRDNKLTKYPKIGYQFFYVINEYKELDFKSEYESTSKQLLNKNEFISKHHNWLLVHQELLNIATKDFKNKKKLKP